MAKAILAIVDRALCALLTVCMVVTFVDVCGRYVFGRPLRGADDINGILVALIVFGALPVVTARGDHIRIELLDSVMPPRLRHGLFVVFGLVATVLLAIVSWRLAGLAVTMAEFRDASPMLKVPLAPVAMAMAALCLTAALVQALRTWRRQ